MSIDRQLALRNNMSPQQLMQRYSVSNELLDLLALQKMQSEIAAKKRDQMAQMAQQPGTIKEQKEREVFQAVREEIAPMAQRAQQVTAAEQQKQLQQQRAMQMLAQSVQQQGASGAPMMSGIASAPAPNMRMAQGGIVGYAEGDLVENEEDPVVTRGPLAGLPQLEANTNVYATPEVTAATERLRTAEGNLRSAYSARPKEERVSARDEAANFLRREQMRKAEEARIAELRRAMARTPEELARERQKGFLLGAANRGKGYVGAGASAGLQAVLDAQRAERIGNLEKLQGLARDMETRDIGIGTEGLKSGRTAEEQAALGLRGLLGAASDEQSAVLRAASDMADLKFRQDKENQEGYIEAAKAAYQSAQDALQNATNNLERLQAERDRMDSEVAAVREALVASQGYGRAVNTLQAGQPVVIGGREITSEAELAAYYNQMAVELVNNAMGGGNRYQEARRALDQAISRLMGNIGMPTPGLPAGVSSVTPSGR